MQVRKGECWGVIPARGGSKSIPLKNIAPFAGRPLIDYNILSAQAAKTVSRLICSTDSPEISEHCRAMQIEVHDRPAEFAGDDARVDRAISQLLEDIHAREAAVAEFIALLQPTSPFLLPGHIDACVGELKTNPGAGSAQTVTECPHNHHAFNQRIVTGSGEVSFRFEAERRRGYNKQNKPRHFVFGNVIVFRSDKMLAQGTVFAQPSRAIEIEWPYDFDADGPQDFKLGALLLEQGMVALPFIDGPQS